ncbi:potassium-transporting ATPase subunit F [Leucobacter massiliensis]|nr:potassium-transporting ATPase subunit F [Leucobacter massiliensis]
MGVLEPLSLLLGLAALAYLAYALVRPDWF